MGKRRPSFDSSQLGFTFDPPARVRDEAELAGFDRGLAAKVAAILKDDDRSREVIAAEMSALLAEPVSKMMLDAYASEARDQHNIPAHRFLALIAVTERFDVLDAACRRIGAAVMVGEEINAIRLGHLQARRDQIDAEIKKLRGVVRPIEREGRRK
jgi:hypothetical protein